MKRVNYMLSAAICVVAITFLLFGQIYGKNSLDGYTSSASWPNFLSILLLGMGILLAAWNTFSKDVPDSKIDFKSLEFRNVLIVMASILVLFVAFRYLGCLISLGIFFPLFMWFLGERSWKTIIIYDVLSLTIIYVVFVLVLGSKLAEPFFM